MGDYGRRITIDLPFEMALTEVTAAVSAEELRLVARIDVRDRMWRDLGHEFRHYALLDVWSPELALEALRHDLTLGIVLPTTVAVYELADGETAVVARQPFVPISEQMAWRTDDPMLAAIVDEETRRVARMLERLQHAAARTTPEIAAI